MELPGAGHLAARQPSAVGKLFDLTPITAEVLGEILEGKDLVRLGSLRRSSPWEGSEANLVAGRGVIRGENCTDEAVLIHCNA